MKKALSLIIMITVLCSVFTAVRVCAEDVSYARFVATGNDPYAKFNFNPNGNHSTIDPDKVKWASVKYRTITKTDNTGVELIGQLYVLPDAEPFIPIKYVHSEQWETLTVDLTGTSEKTAMASKWNSQSYTTTTGIRFDPLESNRDAEAAQSEHDAAFVSDADSIDIAWIAFFENEADAKAYDGTQDTPYCILLPTDFENPTGASNMNVPEAFIAAPPAVTEAPTEAATEPQTDMPTEQITEIKTEEPTEAVQTSGKPATVTESPFEQRTGGKTVSPVVTMLISVAIVFACIFIVAALISWRRNK